MSIFRYALCFLFYGHDKERIIQDNLESRESLVECDRCGHLRTERMWFERWWRLITPEEREEYLDVYRYNPLKDDCSEYDLHDYNPLKDDWDEDE